MNIKSVFRTIREVFCESRYLCLFKRDVIPGTSYIAEMGKKPDLKKLSVSQYIIAETALPNCFIKKEKQILISAFIQEKKVFFGRTQRTLLMSDYIIFPECSDLKAFVSEYMLDGLYCGKILIGKKDKIICDIMSGNIPDGICLRSNSKKVLIYAGSLAQNGLTASLLNLLSSVDSQAVDIRITYREEALKRNPENIRKIPERFMSVPVAGKNLYSLSELVCYILYYKCGIEWKFIVNRLDEFYKREWKRLYGEIKPDCAVHFTGYEYGVINLFRAADVRRVIYVHNNMKEEIRLRKNQHEPTLRRAYNEFDAVALVTEDMRESAMEISRGGGNMRIAPNCHNWKEVIRKSLLPIEFQKETDSTVSISELNDLLQTDKVKFITIGRYSQEKAHMRLIDAFSEYYSEHPDTVLIIIGGRGELYEDTVRYAKKSGAEIILIRSMENPMPVLKQCSLFILPSLYEGLGLVILEADTLGIPTVATDILGPRGFMKKYGGTLTENSKDGILN
ncbi:MAG: glycosyltransferase, partial [Oscillospiraceae bacterium]|nr:glycosyltransferase [Oscillospiraceae bacterium]